MEANLINEIGHKYYKLSLWIIVGLSLMFLLLLGGTSYWNTSMLYAILISAVFSFFTSVAYIASWKGIAKNSPSTLTKFYLVAPVLRMMAAVLVILVYYVVNRNATNPDGSPAIYRLMDGFIFIFLAYCYVLLVLDSVYFAKVEKRNKLY